MTQDGIAIEPASALPAAEPAREAPPRNRTWARLLRSPAFSAGRVIVVRVLLLAFIVPALSPFDAQTQKIRDRLQPPGVVHLLGTDHFGRDMLTRIAVGAQMSLLVGLAVATITGILGTIIGAAAGYLQRLDNVLMRIMDALMAFPSLLLAIAITAALGPGLVNVIVALSVAYVPRTARIVRSSALVARQQQYVEAARVAGAGTVRILCTHIVPNCMGALIVQVTFVFAYAILAEATLSYLGVGLPPPAPTWGNLIAEGREYIVEAWWISLFAGIATSLAVLSFNLLGDGLRDVLDPNLRVEA
jgi:peptide/nickel transport system permease protein